MRKFLEVHLFDGLALSVAIYYVIRHIVKPISLYYLVSGLLYILALLALSGIWRKNNKGLFRLLGIAFVLSLVWHGFLTLVAPPPLDTTPALIMVWASGLILILGFFPEIFDRIEMIGIKNLFEVRLSKTLLQASETTPISPFDFDISPNVSEKANWNNLRAILRELIINRKAEQLLVVNVKTGDYISIVMLYIYIFFIEYFSKGCIVLFVSTRGKISSLDSINSEKTIGVVTGKSVLTVFQERYPGFRSIWRKLSSNRSSDDQYFENEIPTEFELDRLANSITLEIFEPYRYQVTETTRTLSKENVRIWFKEHLNTIKLDLDRDEKTAQLLGNALDNRDKFVILIQNSHLKSIVPLCDIAMSIAHDCLKQKKSKKT